jgi:hypothetical protein
MGSSSWPCRTGADHASSAAARSVAAVVDLERVEAVSSIDRSVLAAV